MLRCYEPWHEAFSTVFVKEAEIVDKADEGYCSGCDGRID